MMMLAKGKEELQRIEGKAGILDGVLLENFLPAKYSSGFVLDNIMDQ